MNYPLLATYSLLTLVITILILMATVAANKIKAKANFLLFILSIFALASMALFQVDIYPFSNVAIISFGVFGGSALASILSKRGKAIALLTIMFIVSALDILSFATGPQTSSSNSSSIPDTLSIYINFVINITKGEAYKLGSLDILMLSLSQAFLIFKELPFLFVLLFNTSGGLPLIPFISFCSAFALILHDNPRLFKGPFEQKG